MKLFSIVCVVCLIPQIAVAEDSIGRFQMTTNPLIVLDTVTGQIWKADGNMPNEYFMRRICYQGSGGQLMPTPWEDEFTKDLSKFKAECGGQPTARQ